EESQSARTLVGFSCQESGPFQAPLPGPRTCPSRLVGTNLRCNLYAARGSAFGSDCTRSFCHHLFSSAHRWQWVCRRGALCPCRRACCLCLLHGADLARRAHFIDWAAAGSLSGSFCAWLGNLGRRKADGRCPHLPLPTLCRSTRPAVARSE